MTPEDREIENLRILIEEAGTARELADRADTDAAYISQILNKTPTKAGTPRRMGRELRTKLEEAMDKPRGWLTFHGVPAFDGYSQGNGSPPPASPDSTIRRRLVIQLPSDEFEMLSLFARMKGVSIGAVARQFLADGVRAAVGRAVGDTLEDDPLEDSEQQADD